MILEKYKGYVPKQQPISNSNHHLATVSYLLMTVITPPKGSASNSTIDNPHGSAATLKSTTENRHESASIEAKGAKARSNDFSQNNAELQQPPMTKITDP